MKTLRLLPRSFSLASLCISLQKHHLQRQCFKLRLNWRKIYSHTELHLVVSGFAIKPHISQCILSKSILKAAQKHHYSIIFSHICQNSCMCFYFLLLGWHEQTMILVKNLQRALNAQWKQNKTPEWEENLSLFCHYTNWHDLPDNWLPVWHKPQALPDVLKQAAVIGPLGAQSLGYHASQPWCSDYSRMDVREDFAEVKHSYKI